MKGGGRRGERNKQRRTGVEARTRRGQRRTGVEARTRTRQVLKGGGGGGGRRMGVKKKEGGGRPEVGDADLCAPLSPFSDECLWRAHN